jgi:tRNA threonylcarbamoyl adenosine modification protein (Sua5/YciO/YrdC/YwlC family)
MAANILVIDSQHPQPHHIGRAVAVLEAEGVIAYPTDSYYGIGCDIFSKKAIERVYQLKQRDRRKPLSFICADLGDVSQYAKVSNFGHRILRRLTPGPYTFILEATKVVPEIMTTKQKQVAIRIPDSPITAALVRGMGRPLLSTSASDPENGEVLIDPLDIKDRLGHGLDLIIDGGFQLNEPSTVLSLVGDEVEVLREGKGNSTRAF